MQDDCFGHYVAFCKKLDWCPTASRKANPIIEDEIMRQFGLSQKHDIPNSLGKAQRGWKGLKVK